MEVYYLIKFVNLCIKLKTKLKKSKKILVINNLLHKSLTSDSDSPII